MPVVLSPLTPERLPFRRQRCLAEYEADLVAAGEAKDESHRHASDAIERTFPSDADTPGNAVFDLVTGVGDVVGYLWVGLDSSGDNTSWWVWDVVVEPAHRGKGYGREAMRLAEDYARSKGARTLGLSVFGFNAAARELYESVGYETTSVKMRKQL